MNHNAINLVNLIFLLFSRFRKLELESTLFKTAAKEQIKKEKSVNAELRHVSSFSRGRNRISNNENYVESDGASG